MLEAEVDGTVSSLKSLFLYIFLLQYWGLHVGHQSSVLFGGAWQTYLWVSPQYKEVMYLRK